MDWRNITITSDGHLNQSRTVKVFRIPSSKTNMRAYAALKTCFPTKL